MSTASNAKEELTLHQIQWQIHRVAKKDALIHALAIGFNHSLEKIQDGKYTSKQHPNFTAFPTCVALFAQKQQIKETKGSPLIEANTKKCVIQVQEYFCMVQNKIKLDTDYHVQSKTIDAQLGHNGKQAIYVNRSAGYLINKKDEKDLAFYSIDVMIEVNFFKEEFRVNCRDFQGWPSRKHDLVFKEKSFRSQSFLYVANSASNPIHSDLKAAIAVGLPRPTLPSKAIFAMMMRIIVQNLLAYDQSKVKESQMKLVGLAFPGDEFQIRVWKQEGKFYVQAIVMERKTRVVRGLIGVRHSPKI